MGRSLCNHRLSSMHFTLNIICKCVIQKDFLWVQFGLILSDNPHAAGSLFDVMPYRRRWPSWRDSDSATAVEAPSGRLPEKRCSR